MKINKNESRVVFTSCGSSYLFYSFLLWLPVAVYWCFPSSNCYQSFLFAFCGSVVFGLRIFALIILIFLIWSKHIWQLISILRSFQGFFLYRKRHTCRHSFLVKPFLGTVKFASTRGLFSLWPRHYPWLHQLDQHFKGWSCFGVDIREFEKSSVSRYEYSLYCVLSNLF